MRVSPYCGSLNDAEVAVGVYNILRTVVKTRASLQSKFLTYLNETKMQWAYIPRYISHYNITNANWTV